jgi:hypothetical protein
MGGVSFLANNSSGAPQSTPTATPGATTPTQLEPAAKPVPAGVASGGNALAADLKTMNEAADKAIAAGAQIAGISITPAKDHVGRVLNAAQVFSALTELGKHNPAMKAEAGKFLRAMADAGRKFGINFGLREFAAARQVKGEALNANVFRGVDTANNPYFKENKALANEWVSRSVAQPQAVQPQAQGLPDLSQLDVKKFVQALGTNDKGLVSAKELQQPKDSDNIDATGKQLITLLLPNMPEAGVKPQQLENELLLLQQRQQQQRPVGQSPQP